MLKNGYIMIAGLFLFLFIAACGSGKKEAAVSAGTAELSALTHDTIRYPQEHHLAHVRQLTFAGDNAEGYFSFDGTRLVFQHRNKEEGVPCDQIYYGRLPSDDSRFEFSLLSTGRGRTTCSYFLPGDTTILYASTHGTSDSCISDPDRSKGYLWGVYNSYEIYVADLQGHILRRLTDNDAYDAEATVSPNGDRIVFTSDRSGDLELWTMHIDGSDLKQITNTLGYDGGAFFSPDGTKIIFRASRPKTDAEIKEYKDLLAKQLVKPLHMELFICNADGSDMRQLTNLGGANWAPFFTPDGQSVIFSSNYKTQSIPFNLYIIHSDGTGLEQITWDSIFDAFPVFSPDGKELVFGSNRNGAHPHDTNLFIADWVN